MSKPWKVVATATDPHDNAAFVEPWNMNPRRFRFRRSAHSAARFYERMLGPWMRFYVVRDEQ